MVGISDIVKNPWIKSAAVASGLAGTGCYVAQPIVSPLEMDLANAQEATCRAGTGTDFLLVHYSGVTDTSYPLCIDGQNMNQQSGFIARYKYVVEGGQLHLIQGAGPHSVQIPGKHAEFGYGVREVSMNDRNTGHRVQPGNDRLRDSAFLWMIGEDGVTTVYLDVETSGELYGAGPLPENFRNRVIGEFEDSLRTGDELPNDLAIPETSR